MKKFLILIPVIFIVGCATTQSSDYVKVYDRKSNTWTYLTKGTNDPGAFVGTSAAQSRPGRLPGQHP